jgi:hypothetical protein
VPYWLGTPSVASRRWPRPGRFLPSRSSPQINFAVNPLLRLGPLRSLVAGSHRRNAQKRLPLLGFPSPLAPSAWEVYLFAKLCLLRLVPTTGFPNLLTACSSQCLVALFHATGTCGVLPSELFPVQEPYRLSPAFALLSFPVRRLASEKKRDARTKPPSRLCSPGKSVARRRFLRPPAARGSPGIMPL